MGARPRWGGLEITPQGGGRLPATHLHFANPCESELRTHCPTQ